MTHNVVFISYARKDWKIAKKLRKKLQKLDISVFLDKVRLKGGDKFPEKIRKNLLFCTALIVLVTRNSLKSRWVMRECSAAWALGKRIIPVQPAGAKWLRQFLRFLRRSDSPTGLLELLKEVQMIRDDELNAKFPTEELKPSDPTTRYNGFLAAAGTGCQTLCAPVLGSSPFVFEELLRRCQKKIVLVGQNLRTILVNNEANTRRLLKGFLDGGSDRSVEVLISDPKFKPGITVHCNMCPGTGVNFAQHLQQSVAVLQNWKKGPLKGLNFVPKKYFLIPVSATFVDPDEPNGMVVLVPVLEHLPGRRPCLFLDKTLHESAFNYYWTYYKTAFNNAKPL